jgi:hypothetical protein
MKGRRKYAPITALLVICALIYLNCSCSLPLRSNNRTVIGVRGGEFLLNGTPRFLLGFSYFGALGASRKIIQADLHQFQKRGFNWVRVWATWAAFETNVSAVDQSGYIREPFMSRLRWFVDECDRRGMAVDITLTRRKSEMAEGGLLDFDSHERAIRSLIHQLKSCRNWYLDLANEHDVRDARHVPDEELKQLRNDVRSLDPSRLVTSSFGGHDLNLEELRSAVFGLGFDFIAVHRPRTPETAGESEAKTRWYRNALESNGKVVPILYQEPFRRGYENWQPKADDFVRDLHGAKAGGAGGWCFHTGADRRDRGHLRRCFDLSEKGLYDQLDEEELEFLNSDLQ